MGAFQAVASGLGQAGEQAGQGINDALTQALKVRAQNHLEEMDQARLDLASKTDAAQQAYRTASLHQDASQFQQQHELARETLIKGGWKDLGAQLDTSSGKYFRTMHNDVTNQTSKVYLDGVPPDSPAGQVSYMKTLQGLTGDDGKPLFTPMQAKEVAFKMPSLYRDGPAGTVQSFIDDAKDFKANGTKVVTIPGIGKFDITTPQGETNYATAMLSTIHSGGLYRALAGPPGGKPGDQTGWTANETREYKATADQATRTETALTKLMEVQISNTLDPQAQQAISSRFMDQIQNVWKQADSKQAEINARHQFNPNNVRGLLLQDGKWVEGTIPKGNKDAAIASGRFKLLPPSGPVDTGASVGGQ